LSNRRQAIRSTRPDDLWTCSSLSSHERTAAPVSSGRRSR
jgi:hypothetical protein